MTRHRPARMSCLAAERERAGRGCGWLPARNGGRHGARRDGDAIPGRLRGRAGGIQRRVPRGRGVGGHHPGVASRRRLFSAHVSSGRQAGRCWCRGCAFHERWRAVSATTLENACCRGGPRLRFGPRRAAHAVRIALPAAFCVSRAKPSWLSPPGRLQAARATRARRPEPPPPPSAVLHRRMGGSQSRPEPQPEVARERHATTASRPEREEPKEPWPRREVVRTLIERRQHGGGGASPLRLGRFLSAVPAERGEPGADGRRRLESRRVRHPQRKGSRASAGCAAAPAGWRWAPAALASPPPWKGRPRRAPTCVADSSRCRGLNACFWTPSPRAP